MKIQAKKIPEKEVDIEEVIARFCYLYPQYRYDQARKLPYKRLLLMMKVADKERARLLYELTQIAAAPHTEKGEGVRELLSRYEEIINN